MPKFTATAPAKPYPDFPLFTHNNGQWAKKIRSKLHYFGAWSDPDAALAKYLDQKDELKAGRKPRAGGKGLTVKSLVNAFLTSKRHLVDTSELTPRSFADYYRACERIVKAFGAGRLVEDLAADDFEQFRATLAKTLGPVALGNEVNRVRVVFKYAADNRLIERTVTYGQSFKRPSRKTLRRERHAKGKRLFAAAEILTLLKSATPPLKAMILLGINCGLGNRDVASVPEAAFDLKAGWLDFPRPKTEVPRRCPLWGETIAALKAAWTVRPEATDPAAQGLAFVTRHGNPWVRSHGTYDADTGKHTFVPIDSVALEFGKLLRDANLARPGLGFYALRHTFETVAGECKDQIAVDSVMGHAPAGNDMSSVYREGISDERLQAAAEHVRQWLFPPKAKSSQKRAAK